MKVYDVAVAVNEGIYRIGSVHVGLYKKHIDQLINKLRTTFLGFRFRGDPLLFYHQPLIFPKPSPNPSPG
jgi:hypothetical protein